MLDLPRRRYPTDIGHDSGRRRAVSMAAGGKKLPHTALASGAAAGVVES